MERRCALITGIVGGVARIVGKELSRRGFTIVGIDYRPLTDPLPYAAEIYRASYNKTKIEDVFRRHRPTHVVHLGRVGNLKQTIEKRFDLNVVGSRKVMDLSLRYGASRLIVLSTFHIYGAHPHNHTPIAEDEPLRAGQDFPQIADAIQLDNQAIAWMYQHPEVTVAVLRPTNVVGPDVQNAMSTFLRSRRVPVMIGFDPMVQFIHQADLVGAILVALESDDIGVFNLAGEGTIPWRKAVEVAGKKTLPVPSTLAIQYLKMAGLVSDSLPPYLVNFLRYPCVITDAAFRGTFGWAPQISQEEALKACVM
jgi:UDP-glucose 4-epimerase